MKQNAKTIPELAAGFPQQSVINRETLASVTPVISFREKGILQSF